MKALIIDDIKGNAEELARGLEEIFNYEEDDKPMIKTNPMNGIDAMNHTYDLVFIDFFFANKSNINGADVGLEIRKKYPLATLILVTAYGKENILKYIHVGFDAYLNKDDETKLFELTEEDLKKVIEIGVSNSQKRIKSKFTTEELSNVKEKLDAIETILEKGAYRNLGEAVVYGDLYQKGVSIEEIKNNAKKIDICIRNKKPYIDNSGKEYKLIGRTSLNTYLKVYDKSTIHENALKIRQILLENNFMVWPNVSKKVKPFKTLLDDFNIKLNE
ncbi:MAG: response regulator [Bacteroidota bacterium]